MFRITLLVMVAFAAMTTASAEEIQKPKAIVFYEYGTPDVLKFEDVEKPILADDQVLIKVRAAAVNPLDWHRVRGRPYLMRIDGGISQPKEPLLGTDVAGVVEAVGKMVTRFKPGDEVFGVGLGAFGTYAKAAERRLTLKPKDITFEDAAAMPVAAVTALQALRDKGKIQPGQKVLINGASGGVGTYAVQIAKALGANVTGVCSTRNVELVRALGADRVIDYTQTDFAKDPERYDVVIDNVGNRAFSDIRSVLKHDGNHVLVGGGGVDDNPIIGPLGAIAWAYVMSPFVSQKFEFMLAEVTGDELNVLTKMMEEKKLRSVIDRAYTLPETPAALAYVEQGRARGKVVITVTQD
jgi:NADPH:quinone reductase-like Zn-dependent oxidoreductase